MCPPAALCLWCRFVEPFSDIIRHGDFEVGLLFHGPHRLRAKHDHVLPIAVKVKFGHDLRMSESDADTWFKLRLSAPLRKKLETEATSHGRTLTAEILSRLEATLSGSERRIEELERLTSDEDYGNRALWDHYGEMYSEIETLKKEVAAAKEAAGIMRYDD